MTEVRREVLYATPAHFVLVNGRPFTPQLRPTGIRTGGFRQCFDNAFRLARRRKLIYVEGYAIRGFDGWRCHPVLHAWCSTSDGLVVDNTWKDGLEYFGVPIDLAFLQQTRETSGQFSVLDNWEQGYPILRSGTAVWQYRDEIGPSAHIPLEVIAWLRATSEFVGNHREVHRSEGL